jgi:hypothetical protein
MQKNYFCANDEAFLALLAKGLDGGSVDLKDQLKVKAALQAFVHKPVIEQENKIKEIKARIQAVASSTDFPVNATNLFNLIVDQANYDMGWQAAFRDVPKDAGKQFWEIATVHNGIIFRRIPEGGRIRVEEISGENVLAYVDSYGGALGFTDAMIRYRQLAIMFDKAIAFRDSFYLSKADNHYLLIWTAGHAHILPWQAGATQLIRDLATINLASATLGNTNKDKGYGVTGQTPFILYANPFDEARIEMAFAQTATSLAQGGIAAAPITGRPIRRIYTYNRFIQQNHPILCLPGQKSQIHEELAPLTYNAPEDILTLNKMQSVWSIYGAAIADDEQFLQVDLA